MKGFWGFDLILRLRIFTGSAFELHPSGTRLPFAPLCTFTSCSFFTSSCQSKRRPDFCKIRSENAFVYFPNIFEYVLHPGHDIRFCRQRLTRHGSRKFSVSGGGPGGGTPNCSWGWWILESRPKATRYLNREQWTWGGGQLGKLFFEPFSSPGSPLAVAT